MRSLAILGAGGHGRVAADCAESLGWRKITLFDDGPVAGSTMPWSVAGKGNDLIARLAEFDGVIVGIGNNEIRVRWHRRLIGQGANLVTLIHPKASVSAHCDIGAGSVVFAGAVVNIGSRLGQACIINTVATVDHDNILADGVHVSPGANLGGDVQVGEASWIGIGAAVRHGIVIGERVRVGAGAVVVKPIRDGLTVVGSPAVPIEERSNA